jgi:hypothetical protein
VSRVIRIGAGAAWWGDRIEPAGWNAARGDLDYLCFETMAEATVSAAQVRKRRDPSFPGYDTHLDARMEAVLPACLDRGTRIITNQGWINPVGAAERIAQHLRKLGATGRQVAAVEGSVVTDRIAGLADRVLETGQPVRDLLGQLISAEVYLGAGPIVEALTGGADVVVTGRVADPSIFLAPMIYEHHWSLDDVGLMGQGTGVGHLMECGAQVTGGYFADPGFKDVPEVWNLAFPIAEVDANGTAVITKIADTGGYVDLRTVKEQLLYEVHDPANYLTPDVVVDFTTTRLEQIGPDRVRVAGIGGKPKTPTLKATIAVAEGFAGEDMFFYAGPGALRRAELAKEVLLRRFELVGLVADEVRIDFLGVNAVHGPASRPGAEPYEVGVRVAARCATRNEADKVGREVDAMAVSGVGMTGKRGPFQDRVREIVGVWSALVDRNAVEASITVVQS